MPECTQEEKKKYCIFTTDMEMPQHKNSCPSTKTPAPGVMKLKMLVDSSLVIKTLYLVCLIYASV